jgi:hypothetical protein
MAVASYIDLNISGSRKQVMKITTLGFEYRAPPILVLHAKSWVFMTTLMGQSCRVLVTQALLVDFKHVQRCLSITTVVPNGCSPVTIPRTGKRLVSPPREQQPRTFVGTLKTGYPRIQALSQDKEHVVHPRAAMQVVDSDHTSLQRWAPVLPCVPQLQALPPCRGGLRRCHVFLSSRPRLPAEVGSDAAMCSVALGSATPRGELRR